MSGFDDYRQPPSDVLVRELSALSLPLLMEKQLLMNG